MDLSVLGFNQILQFSDVSIPLADVLLVHLGLVQHLQRHDVVPTVHHLGVFLGLQLLDLGSQPQVGVLMANLGYLDLVVLAHLSLFLQLLVQLFPGLLVPTLQLGNPVAQCFDLDLVRADKGTNIILMKLGNLDFEQLGLLFAAFLHGLQL